MKKLLIAIVIFVGCSKKEDAKPSCDKKECSNFKTQSEAKQTFDSNKECYKNLDSDNDGLPCENSPK